MEVVIMNQYVTGEGIRILRERNHCTQLQLADKIGVSDKTFVVFVIGMGCFPQM